jgi:hypothetical protein
MFYLRHYVAPMNVRGRTSYPNMGWTATSFSRDCDVLAALKDTVNGTPLSDFVNGFSGAPEF